MFKDATEKHFNERDNLIVCKKKIFKDEVDVKQKDLKTLFDKTVDSKVWKTLEDKCVSCGKFFWSKSRYIAAKEIAAK